MDSTFKIFPKSEPFSYFDCQASRQFYINIDFWWFFFFLLPFYLPLYSILYKVERAVFFRIKA